MTKADLLDWAISHGCISVPTTNDKSFALFLRKDNRQAIFNTHRMDEEVDIEYITFVCIRLNIPIPLAGTTNR
jgi:hypothetical protein